ncbi:MAG: RluA family pseudouridine synthase [Fibrobacter sp.]|uniref:pseudouridine synthase n=1 Tax=Fibrobacter sp. TaxID=35828 RepID=UPI0025C6270B|nr:pseudouridine synthase [Fibrobacter sp.]MBR4785367.1 RluA family pseudouridine synthase [Fibrobacter sp.]
MKAPRDMYFESEVRPEQNGRPLLDSLVERFTYHSREEWVDRFTRGLVTLNGAVAGLDTIAHKGDKVVYHVENYEEPEVPTDFDTVFEDDEFILVAKPAGIPVHHTGRIFYNTFASVVRRATDCETATPMHRLDRDTGGLMLFAKYAETAARFQKNLDRILLGKFYLAVVRGEFPHEEYRCDFPLREDPASPLRVKMFRFDDGKPCSTIFRRLKVFERDGQVYSALECELLTGRKHQIRAHLAELGFPIVADRLYAHDGVYYDKLAREGLSEEDYRFLGGHYHMLYAYKVKLFLPYWDSPRVFTSDNFPSEMKSLLADFAIL